MYLAEGLVAFGGAVLWKRGDLRSPVPDRARLPDGDRDPTVRRLVPRRGGRGGRAARVARPPARAALAGPACDRRAARCRLHPGRVGRVLGREPQELQASQDANAANDDANLSLERVDYSTREKLILNLPERIYDVVFRPYPWQTQNTSQQLGALGTLVVLAALILLAQQLIRNRKRDHATAGAPGVPDAFMLGPTRSAPATPAPRSAIARTSSRWRCACSSSCAPNGNSRRARLEVCACEVSRRRRVVADVHRSADASRPILAA